MRGLPLKLRAIRCKLFKINGIIKSRFKSTGPPRTYTTPGAEIPVRHLHLIQAAINHLLQWNGFQSIPRASIIRDNLMHKSLIIIRNRLTSAKVFLYSLCDSLSYSCDARIAV